MATATTTTLPPPNCTRCGKRLNPDTIEWLELNSRTGLYANGPVPEGESQGWFPFGKRCSLATLAIQEAGSYVPAHR